MILLHGKPVSDKTLELIHAKVAQRISEGKSRPGLAVVRVGEDPASKIYVTKKIETCKKVGLSSKEIHLRENISQDELIKAIDHLNHDATIHGILVQLPLPKHLLADEILETVSPKKDVDGFHPENVGKLVLQQLGFVPCTPKGVMSLLLHYGIEVEGKRAVVVGRSRIVGRPMSLLLDHAGATVTVVHSKTKDMKTFTREAEILVVAAGKPGLITEEYVSPQAIVIDVGIHRTSEGKIVGDVDFESVKSKVKAITPVPGGIGPMTIAMLLENTLQATET